MEAKVAVVLGVLAAVTCGSSCGNDDSTSGAAGSSTVTGGDGGVAGSPGGAGGAAGLGGSGGSSGSGGFVPEPGARSVVYPADWTPGFQTTRPGDGATLFVQDFSYAGYRNSEVPLPTGDFAPVFPVAADATGTSDATAAIQAAIDQAEASSSGGIVLLPAGLFRLDGYLTVEGSNVVLRGAGSDQTRLWFVDGGGVSQSIALLVTGSSWLAEQNNPSWAITREGAIFEDFVDVADASGIAAGDDISVAWEITAEFKAEHNSSAYWYHVTEGDLRPFFRRTVTSVSSNRIFFHVPLRYPVKLRDHPVVLRATHYASGNGVEHLAVNTALGGPTASWNSGVDQASAIYLRFCKDCWLRDVASFAVEGEQYHLRSHGIFLDRSFRVTVADCHLQSPEHLGGSGNGYLFQLSRSNEVLMRDCIGHNGRHNFSLNWEFGASGNVFLRIESSGGRVCDSLQQQLDGDCGTGPSDFHHALAIANLFDNARIDDALQVGNRRDWSIGAGQTGTMNVFWHVLGTGKVLAYNQAMGYAIGTMPGISVSTELALETYPEWYLALDTEPEDFTEFLGEAEALAPSSLFEEQLARRLAR